MDIDIRGEENYGQQTQKRSHSIFHTLERCSKEENSDQHWVRTYIEETLVDANIASNHEG
jgi:hypothetical protein